MCSSRGTGTGGRFHPLAALTLLNTSYFLSAKQILLFIHFTTTTSSSYSGHHARNLSYLTILLYYTTFNTTCFNPDIVLLVHPLPLTTIWLEGVPYVSYSDTQ